MASVECAWPVSKLDCPCPKIYSLQEASTRQACVFPLVTKEAVIQLAQPRGDQDTHKAHAHFLKASQMATSPRYGWKMNESTSGGFWIHSSKLLKETVPTEKTFPFPCLANTSLFFMVKVKGPPDPQYPP